MPPKTKIKKEDIIDVTFEIVRKEGLESVHARRIAKELGCSVQPIFSNFSNMNDLKQEVFQKAFEKYMEYITTHVEGENAYKSMGIKYIQLAKEEPKIFEMLFMTKSNLTFDHFMVDNESFGYIEKAMMKYDLINQEHIPSFHSKMWFFVHGIASLVANETCTFTDEEISRLLTEQFTALVLLEKYNKER